MRSWLVGGAAGAVTFAALTGLPFAAQAGPLSLDGFFNGNLFATGTVENLRDGGKRDFTIAMNGTWSGPQGTLSEDVVYQDGEREHKVWRFEKTGPGRYAGRRADVTGDAEIVEDDRASP